MAKKIGLIAAALVVAFLAGFLPEYSKRTSAESQLKQAERRNRQADVRDLAALAYVQAAQKNFGMAAQTAGRLFDRVQALASDRTDPAESQRFAQVLTMRDSITAGLAKADPAVLSGLQELYLKTRAATGGQ